MRKNIRSKKLSSRALRLGTRLLQVENLEIALLVGIQHPAGGLQVIEAHFAKITLASGHLINGSQNILLTGVYISYQRAPPDLCFAQSRLKVNLLELEINLHFRELFRLLLGEVEKEAR